MGGATSPAARQDWQVWVPGQEKQGQGPPFLCPFILSGPSAGWMAVTMWPLIPRPASSGAPEDTPRNSTAPATCVPSSQVDAGG